MRRLSDVDYIVDENGCWVWQLGRTGPGGKYGQKWDPVKRKSVRAHRWHYEQVHGPIPDGLTLDHLCENTLCVNPDHQDPCTLLDNRKRSDRLSGPRCKHGHLRSEENTRIRADGSRRCILCEKEWNRVNYLNRKG